MCSTNSESFIFAGSGASSIVTAGIFGKYISENGYNIIDGNIFNSYGEHVNTYGLSGGLLTGLLVSISSNNSDFILNLTNLEHTYRWSNFTQVLGFAWPIGLGGNTRGVEKWVLGISDKIKGKLPTIVVKDEKTSQILLYEGEQIDYAHYAKVVAAACTSKTLGLGYPRVKGKKLSDAASKTTGVHAAGIIPGIKTIFDGLGFMPSSKLPFHSYQFIMNLGLNYFLGKYFYGQQTGIEAAKKVVSASVPINLIDTVLRVISMNYAKARLKKEEYSITSIS